MNAHDLLAERLARPVTEAPLNQYTADLVEGVVAHWTDINELLTTYSQGWTLERMPSVDRAILRLGAYEVLYAADVPEGVAIAEAVELAKSLSTEMLKLQGLAPKPAATAGAATAAASATPAQPQTPTVVPASRKPSLDIAA